MLDAFLLTAAMMIQMDATSTEAARPDARASAAVLLREALEEPAERADGSSARFETLVEAGRSVIRELEGTTFAGTLREPLRTARWRAVTDVRCATEELTDVLRDALEDLVFEPRLEADLPEGFPLPTPVREIELKNYPRYRAARASMGRGGSNGAFWKLLDHIKRNDIAMTAPVETTYVDSSEVFGETSMAFLYGSTELGESGREGSVEVIDVEPAQVASIGCRGPMTPMAIDEALVRLRDWIEARGDLDVAGEMRTMGYNSPMVAPARRTFEVQIPVRPLRNKIVIDFSDESEARRWASVDDVVMGGVSSSRFTASGEGTCVFTGDVSLENNGGFASVRTAASDFGLQGASALSLRFRGDGKTYKIRLRTTGAFDGVNYQIAFETEAGVWMERTFLFEDFVPVRRGRLVRSAAELAPGRVRGVGFLISDKQVGEFRLEVASLSRL